MDDFHLEATERTPEITLSPKEGVFVIKGESFPEDVASFYGKLINNIDSLKDNLVKPLNVDIALVYTNSSSIKALYRIFEGLENIRQAGGELVVKWHHEADDDIMEELGEDFHDRFPDLGVTVVPK